MKEEHALIDWVSPSGFPASQAYFEDRIHRINTMLAGAMKIRVLSEADEASVLKNAKGMAPNFVHSMDAAHLHLTTEACVKEGIVDLAMIHDDYGTHAANSQAMFRIIREQFVRMYEENDPIAQFKERYPFITEPPPKGALEIRDVLRSQYFFS
jgi:DNA-directed RNA polymerase